MGTNQFLQFDVNHSNMSPQATYASSSKRNTGFTSGSEAPSALCNKVWHQSAMMTSALAQAVSDVTGDDMLDSINSYENLVTSIKKLGYRPWAACDPAGFQIDAAMEYRLLTLSNYDMPPLHLSGDPILTEISSTPYLVYMASTPLEAYSHTIMAFGGFLIVVSDNAFKLIQPPVPINLSDLAAIQDGDHPSISSMFSSPAQLVSLPDNMHLQQRPALVLSSP